MRHKNFFVLFIAIVILSSLLLQGCVSMRRPVIVQRPGPVIINGRSQPKPAEIPKPAEPTQPGAPAKPQPADIMTDARMIGIIVNQRPSDVIIYLEEGVFEVAINDDGIIPDEQLIWKQVEPDYFFVLGPTEETPRLRCVGGRHWYYVSEQELIRSYLRPYYFTVNFRKKDQLLGRGRWLDWWAYVPPKRW